MPGPRLSKSKFVAGLQCLRRLWWTAHEPGAPELVPDAGLLAVFDRGTRVGEAARAHVPGGVLIEFGRDRIGKVVGETQAAMAGGAPVVYEACFREDGVFVAVDILERLGERWNLIEVKSTTSAKPQHVPDAAVQAHVVERAGLRVERIEIMHLNRACHFPDLSNLFARTNVTEEARAAMEEMPAQIAEQRRCLEGALPEVEVGDHCSVPYECPFVGRCWPEPPDNHVGELYRLGRKKRAALAKLGYETIGELPSEPPLGAVADRQRRAVKSGKLIVEGALAEALEPLAPPVTYLDFETVSPAIPVWPGCWPYRQVVVQLSAHVEQAGVAVEHREWLAEGGADPQEASVEHLLEATADARRVAVYASFEAGRIRELAERFPKHAAALEALGDKLVDVLPIVRGHLYHPDFHGSFSLKRVVPALAPEVSYADLPVADGATAASVLETLLLAPETMTDAERQQTRRDLLAYCEKDTWALVALVRVLRRLAA